MLTNEEALMAVRGMIVKRKNARASRSVGCGWLAEEITSLKIGAGGSVFGDLTANRQIACMLEQCNLRELEELEKFLEQK